jgi:hypothetical protein
MLDLLLFLILLFLYVVIVISFISHCNRELEEFRNEFFHRADL